MGLVAQESNYFGLDIGSTAIRLVQLRGSGKPALVTYGDIKVPANLTISDAGPDRDKVAALVQQLVKDAGVGTKNVVVGLPSYSVFAAVITMPKLTPAEVAKAIKYQADQYIPMKPDEVQLDWAILGPAATEDQMEVLLIAAPKTATEKYLYIVEKAGLELVALEANATAVARALLPKSDEAIIILDMASLSSDVTVSYKNSPRLIRSINIGAGVFVKAVAQALGLQDEQAEQFTYRFGLTEGKLEGQVLKAIKPSIDLLTGELEKSTKFFAERYPNVKLTKLVLTGAGVAIPELTTYLANATRLPVEIGNAWTNVSYPSSQQDKLLSVSSEYAAAVGLAERSLL